MNRAAAANQVPVEADAAAAAAANGAAHIDVYFGRAHVK